jgi:PhzF family phenazine biosynthesis protein
MRIPFHQIDAFADRPFTGNPAAVMPLTEWLDDATLLNIAAENNLAETAFLVPRGDGLADYDLRWFAPACEIALCGHATLASGSWALARNRSLDAVTFSTRRAGVLTVARDGARFTLDLPARGPRPVDDTELVAATAAALGAAPAEVLMFGDDYLVAVFATAAGVRALAPDAGAVLALDTGPDLLLIATAPGDGDTSGADVVSRAWAFEAGIGEDPVTGSAHCVIAPYWAERLGRPGFTAYQASARGGHVACRVDGDRVILGGACVEVIDGAFLL